MSTYAIPALYTLAVWWLSTGLVLGVLGIVARQPRRSTAIAVGVFVASLWMLALSSTDASPTGIYVAFTAAILVWGVQELAFLAGWITGPWRRDCPPEAKGWRRTRFAIAAILYHELALAASGLAILATTWGAPNQVGAWTFAILFAMRVSAKLNVFLGVSNLTEGFLPPHLAYLKSFFATKPMNPLFPVSVTLSTVVLALLVDRVAGAEGAAAMALALAATLVALGLLEHWFLVLPLPVEAIWRWYLGERPRSEPPVAAAAASESAEPVSEAQIIPLRSRRTAVQARAAGTTLGYPRPVGSQTSDIRAITGSE